MPPNPNPSPTTTPETPAPSRPDPAADAASATKSKTTRPSARGTAFYERKRAVRACQVCRARRTKCDNLKPSCSFCLKVGAKCIQSPVDLSSFDPASLKILDRLDEVEALIREIKGEKEDGERAHKTRVVGAAGLSVVQPIAQADIQSELQPSPQPLIANRYILPEPAANILTWHVFKPAVAAARAHFPYNSPAFPYALATPPRSAPAPVLSLGMTIGQLTGASPPAPSPGQSASPLSSSSCALPPWSTSLPSSSTSLPSSSTGLFPVSDPPKLDPQTINGLLDHFFCYVHVKNPVLDELTTRHLVQSAMAHGPAYSGELCLSLLVCALGAIATPFGPSADVLPDSPGYLLSRQLFCAAQRHMGALALGSQLFSAQSLFLAGVYMMCVFQTETAWRFFLQSLANCQQFPFLAAGTAHIARHSSSPVSTNVNGGGSSANASASAEAKARAGAPLMAPEPVNQTLHQAIYWSAWKSERELRPMMYLPDFTLNNHDRGFYPSFFPTPPPASRYADDRLADYSGAPAGVITTRAGRERLSWYFYLAEISLRRLTARISSAMLSLAEAARGDRNAFLAAMTAAVPLYEAERDAWKASLPAVMSLEAPAADDDVCRFVLRGTLVNVDDMITWPFVAAFLDKAAHGPVGVELEYGAELAQKGLDTHLQRLVVNRPGYEHRHHGTIQMVYTCTRSALVLLAAALVLKTTSDQDVETKVCMPEDWQEHVSALLDLLVFWRNECPELGERYRIMERVYAMAVA
ncbi:hypothetical protein TD95_003587 [Thielaviopsis punctulata]|uniref:Zn(2)-C6 fungal-type domain-containing protein n=1 Tax=Thielaviopsis punctulata TaxID=72032 RepID=A0A0F4ZHG3_9PEZI|nr:hypothetical protein TD95_003587 [Thielaviopsis punctulata]